MKFFFKKKNIFKPSFIKKSIFFQKKNPFFLSNLFNDIDNINFDIEDKKLIIGYFKTRNLKSTIKQKLLFDIFSSNFRLSVICSKINNDVINQFLINKWLHPIKRAGLFISYIRNLFFLFFKIFFELAKSLIFCYKTIFEKKNLINKLSEENNDFLQVNDIDFNILFEKKGIINQKNFTFVDWLIENYNQEIVFSNSSEDRKLLYNGRKIIFSKKELPALSFFARLKFLVLFLILFIETILRLIIGDYYLLLIFSDLAKSLKVKLIDERSLAKKYFYSQSSYIYRPMWSYYTKNNAEFILFFYSCAFDGYKFFQRYPKPEIGLENMTWDNVFLWSELHKKLLEKQCQKTKFNLVSPIYYFDNTKKDVEISNYLAVFDLVPYRPFFEATFYQNHNFYISYPNLKKYIEDILEITSQKNILIGFKSSKNILNGNKNKFDQRYKYFLKNKISDRFKYFSNDVSPFKLIRNSKCVISFPWTSTAVIAQKMGKPSIFYDPTEKLCNNDRGKHDIKFIQNKDELKNYINNIFDN